MSELTAKDLTVISDLLTSEELAFKKASIYSKTLTDPVTSQSMCEIAACHAQRFNALYSFLKEN